MACLLQRRTGLCTIVRVVDYCNGVKSAAHSSIAASKIPQKDPNPDNIRCAKIKHFLASPTVVPGEAGRKQNSVPKRSARKRLWEIHYDYYKKFWLCFAQQDWVLADALWKRLNVLDVPSNETFLTINLWQQALNRRVPFEQVVNSLEEMETYPATDPLILAMNQNLLDSFYELRELRVLGASRLIVNFAHIAWTSAATIQTRRRHALRCYLTAMDADSTLRTTVKDLEQKAKIHKAEHSLRLLPFPSSVGVAQRVAQMRSQRRRAHKRTQKHNPKNREIWPQPPTARLEASSSGLKMNDLLQKIMQSSSYTEAHYNGPEPVTQPLSRHAPNQTNWANSS